MRPRTSAVAGCLLGALAFAGLAFAESALEAAVRVEPSPDGCITANALRTRVQRWLKPAALRAGIRVMVDAASQPVSFRVERDGAQVAARNFDVLPAACADRLDAVGIAVALAIEHAAFPAATSTGVGGAPEAGAASDRAVSPTSKPVPAGGAEAAPAREPARDAAQLPPAEAQPKPESAKPEAEAKPAQSAKPKERAERKPAEPEAQAPPVKHALRIHAGGSLLFEALPDPAWGASLGAELVVSRRLHVGLAALFAPQSTTQLASGSAHTRLLAGEALVCLYAPAWALALEGCAGAVGGAGFASGSAGLMASRDATAGWAAGVLRAAVRVPASSMFSARVAFDGLANAWRPRLEVQVPGSVPRYVTATTGVVGFATSLELLFELP